MPLRIWAACVAVLLPVCAGGIVVKFADQISGAAMLSSFVAILTVQICLFVYIKKGL